MALRIKYRPRADLVPYAGNPRTHTDAQVAQLVKSIQEFGWTNPILVDEDGGVIAGHGRLLAAELLDLDKVPTITIAGITDEQRRALVIADNQLATNAGWDMDRLAAELQSLAVGDFDLATLGIPNSELLALLAPGTGETDPDDVPAPPKKPKTKTGDLYVMGDHRLMCGDATSAEEVGRLMDGTFAGICFTSPPYAQQRDYGIADVSDWDSLMRGVFGRLPMADDGQVLVNLGLIHIDGEWDPYWEHWIDWMREQGWRRFGWYVWDKISATFKANDGRLWMSHEWVFHFNKKSVPAIEWVKTLHGGEQRSRWGQRKQDGHVAKLTTPGKIKSHKPPDSVARIQRETNNADASVRSHPARFPVALPDYYIKSFPGDVYDPLVGSGTTIIAAEMLGRRCYAMEIDPVYVDVAVKRWEQFTGRKATREHGD